MPRPFTVAIIGAGFSGSLLAVHLLRRCAPALRVYLVEQDRSFGRGLAYATGNAAHLLNVPAGRMSAFSDRPDDFLDWLRRTEPTAGGLAPEPAPAQAGVAAGTFVSRRLYGAYIQALLGEEIWSTGRGGCLFLVADEAVALDTAARPMTLTLAGGRRHMVDAAVLAVGNFPPEAPPVADPTFYGGPLYRPDPWTEEAIQGLDPTVPVLLIGTSLTTIDMVVSLLDQGHDGPIHALSRRGLLPHAHAPGAPVPPGLLPEHYPASVTALLAEVRRRVRRAAAEGIGWRAVIDGLRSVTQTLWRTLPEVERRRFLRHLRPWWDIHRHRLAPAVAARIAERQAAGQIKIHAGRILAYQPERHRVTVTFRPRGAADEVRSLTVARVINGSGPGCDFARIQHPLVRSLLDQGAVRPDALGLGLDVTADGAVIDRAGLASDSVYAVGPVTKGALWEITAVPDIRRQCEALAAHLADHLPAVATDAAEAD